MSVPPKIGDGFSNAKDLLGDCFTTAYTDNGRLWFIGQKGIEQPSISYFHETPLLGGNAIHFDLQTNGWIIAAPFSTISEEELLEGEIFAYGDRLLLLTYQGSNQFRFRDLFEYFGSEWNKFEQFQVDEKTKFECGDRTKLITVKDAASGAVYFVAQRGRGLVISKLNLTSDGKTASLDVICDITEAFPPNSCGARIVTASIFDHYLYAIYGEQGCGFRWNPTRPIRIDLNDGKVEMMKVGDEMEPDSRPPWSVRGANADYMVDTRRWLFFGGHRIRGLSSVEYDQSIWELDLVDKKWKRFTKYDLPKGAVFIGAKKSPAAFYAVNVNEGVYEIPL